MTIVGEVEKRLGRCCSMFVEQDAVGVQIFFEYRSMLKNIL